MNQKFLPIETVALIHEVEPIDIKNIYYKNKSDERFKVVDGNLFVVENYKYPLADELDNLRQKAMIIANNEARLCKELSKISDIEYVTLRQYFYRFTFKHIETAKKVIEALTLYINQNSLFPIEELNYE
jgi:hypothetical protein